jgi:hypothetical protein
MPSSNGHKGTKNNFATFGTLWSAAALYLVRAVRKTAFRQGDKAMTNTTFSKLQSSLFIGVLAIGAFASASPAVAQAQGPAVQVTVPFAFQNGSQHLPAGTYRIDLNSEHVMILRGTDANAAGVAMTLPEQRSKEIAKGKVVFQRYGDHYYIHEVWLPNSTEGRECVTSRAEKRDKQLQLAQNITAPSNVELALNELGR